MNNQPNAYQPSGSSPNTPVCAPPVPQYLSPVEGKSYFDGGLLQLFGWSILGFLITFFTLGFGYPWALCMVYGWEIRHTVVEGRRLDFDGTGAQLFGNWVKWFLLSIITLGIYGFWVGIKIRQWKAKHTFFAR